MPKTPALAHLVALALAATPVAALAQYEITIDVEHPTLRPGESTVVTLYAGFDRRDFAIAGVLTSLGASNGGDGWSDGHCVVPMNGPGTSPGTRSTTGWDDITAGQIHSQTAGIIADRSNPIAFWRATYTAPRDAAAPFDIELSTMTRHYSVYVALQTTRTESRLAELTEGVATIRVIPAPASAAVLALGLLAARRRRGQVSSSSGA